MQHEYVHRAEAHVVRVASGLEFAQAALVLGERRGWLASLGPEPGDPPGRGRHAPLSEYRGTGAALLLARVGRMPSGVVAMHPTGDGQVELKRLYVTRGARGLGLGRRLVEEALAWARERRFNAVVLHTAPRRMAHADELYRSLGFVETGATGGDAIGMELRLPRAI
jgi:GNAT superfamily N-acetyltransferase